MQILMGLRSHRFFAVFLVSASCFGSAHSQDTPWKTVVLREQSPRVIAKYRPITSGCFNEVNYEVWTGGALQLKVDSEVCLDNNPLEALKSQVGWSAPLLSIRETCGGNSIACEANRALILVKSSSAKRIGTFTDYIFLKDQRLVLGLLSYGDNDFVSNALHDLIRYVHVLEGERLVFSSELTWVLNHEKFVRYLNHLSVCAAGRVECKQGPYQSIHPDTALLFTAELAAITGRTRYLEDVKSLALKILSSSKNSDFLGVIGSVTRPQ